MRDERTGSGGDDSGETRNRARRRKRCFHRVISGIEKGGVRDLRFLTLTSSPASPGDIQRSFRRLIMRLKRRGLVKAYIKVTEHNAAGDLLHLHVLVRGSYLDQVWIGRLWNEIHAAPIVHIRKAFGTTGAAGYLSKYMAKEHERYSWDWAWVYRGFAGVWQGLKGKLRMLHQSYRRAAGQFLLRIWRTHLRRHFTAEWLDTTVDTFVYNLRCHDFGAVNRPHLPATS